jgi:hypothetical protein
MSRFTAATGADIRHLEREPKTLMKVSQRGHPSVARHPTMSDTSSRRDDFSS